MRTRFYNHIIGRFTQEDEYRVDGLNLYAYVVNNPVNYIDPSGYKLKAELIERQQKRKNGELKESNFKDKTKPNPSERSMTKEQWKKERHDERFETYKPGSRTYVGTLPTKSWKIILKGMDAHLIERGNVKNRPNLAHFDQKNTPRFYPDTKFKDEVSAKKNRGIAHTRLHNATEKAGIKRTGGNPNLTETELLEKYFEAYSD